MKINIKHVAKLANLTLTKEEEKRFEKQLEVTLDTINKLNEVNTDNTEITSQVTGLENVMDDDIPQPSLSQKKALANAKNTYNGLFVVKAILEE
ncbi:MAG: Asp-tRNA(Asn)/Glu-tRNA(Gln) amidotransferase subunit GatC [Candidatus Levybacteria bacterium]|nr:Asp-tRNA(Asn)/Glu-tRNA(Gln) amidotransferase subunit GatC [Candidatus Levybacteria bacterium]